MCVPVHFSPLPAANPWKLSLLTSEGRHFHKKTLSTGWNDSWYHQDFPMIAKQKRAHSWGLLPAPLFNNGNPWGQMFACVFVEMGDFEWGVSLISAVYKGSPRNCSGAIFGISRKNVADTAWLQLWFSSKTLFKKAYSYLHSFSRWRHWKLKVAELEVSWQHPTVYPLYTKHRNQTATPRSHWKGISFLTVLRN